MKPSTAVPIPITTRGIGFHVHRYYEMCSNIFGHLMPCTIHQMYRVALLQLDIRLQCCHRDSGFSFDPNVDVVYEWPHFKEFTELSIVQENFNAVSRSISSVGSFVLNEIAYQPYVPPMQERSKIFQTHNIEDDENEESDINENVVSDNRLICDPYLVTISNLGSVVKVLSSCDTPTNERIRYKQRNAIPGALFDDSTLLTNALEIMPDNYDFAAASNDMLDFMALLTLVKAHASTQTLVEPVYFQQPGHISILVSVHHPYKADFQLNKSELFYSQHSTIRTYQPMSSCDELSGCVNLMSEYPNTIKTLNEKDWKRWAIRSEYLSTSLYTADWISAVESAAYNETL